MRAKNYFCSLTTTFWHSSAPGVLSTLVTSVVVYSLTRATLMSPGQDKTGVYGYTFLYIHIHINRYLYFYILIYTLLGWLNLFYLNAAISAIYMCVRVCVSTYIFIIYIHTISLYKYLYMYISIHTYIYIYIYIYI